MPKKLKQLSFKEWYQKHKQSIENEMNSPGGIEYVSCHSCEQSGQIELECDTCGECHEHTCCICDGDGYYNATCLTREVEKVANDIFLSQQIEDRENLKKYAGVSNE